MTYEIDYYVGLTTKKPKKKKYDIYTNIIFCFFILSGVN